MEGKKRRVSVDGDIRGSKIHASEDYFGCLRNASSEPAPTDDVPPCVLPCPTKRGRLYYAASYDLWDIQML